MDTELNCEKNPPDNMMPTDDSASRLAYDPINAVDGMYIAPMILLGCVDAALTRRW